MQFNQNLKSQTKLSVPQKEKIRFAIYTRKSCDEGLEQDFNSLDSQRLFCQNYYETIKEDNYELISQSYDDGGYSGGNINRPALQRLLADIRSGLINCILFYKIDRLTRNIRDFFTLADIFKEYHVNFISIKERDMFNTTTPAGRMQLNMFLVFAQFERENAGERIRDKIANSKSLGIWMGGALPLGYNVSNRKLMINETEAQIVREIYQEFITSRSIGFVVDKLNSENKTTKCLLSESGNIRGGKKFSTATVRHILHNALYKGVITDGDKEYKGQHEAIIDAETWNNVQNIFEDNRKFTGRKKTIFTDDDDFILRGILKCGYCKCAMGASFVCKNQTHTYRYYRCYHKQKKVDNNCLIGQISANQIEEIVLKQILEILKTKEIFIKYISIHTEFDFTTAHSLFSNMDKIWNNLFDIEKKSLLKALVTNVTIYVDKIVISINKSGLASTFAKISNQNQFNNIEYKDGHEFNITIPYQTKHYRSQTIITQKGSSEDEPCFLGKSTLIRNLALAYKWRKEVNSGRTVLDIAADETISDRDIRHMIRISYLDPEIIEAIIEGKSPDWLTYHFMKTHEVPLLWNEQRKLYGFKQRTDENAK